MLFSLFKKDLIKFKKETIIFLGLVLTINMFFLYKTYNGWTIESGFAINMFLFPVAFLIPLFLSGSKLIGQEWKDNTIYLTMSLPVSSQKIFLSKFLAVIAQYAISSLSVIAITGIQILIYINRRPYIEQVRPLIDIRLFSMGTFFYILSIAILIYIVSIIFLSSLTGKMFKKYSKLISFGLFFIILVIGGRVVEKTMFFVIQGSGYINTEDTMEVFSRVGLGFLETSLIFLLLSGVIYFATCKIYDKKIEI